MSHLASCFTGSVSSDAKSVSKEIERQIREAKKESRSQVKLLVLGTAESGKSTFIKQMRIIHGKGYTDEDKRSYASLVHQNIVTSVKMLATAMQDLNIKYEKEENHATGEEFDSAVTDEENVELKEEELSMFWQDEGVQQCYRRRNEYHLLDSAAYFLNNLSRITGSDYLPTLQDILRSRLPTSGITEYLFNIDGFIFGIVDVGGQKTERRKWIHCFENVTSIIFLAALSEYDQTIPEEEISQDLRNSLNSLRHQSPSTRHKSPSKNKQRPMVRTNSEQLSSKSFRSGDSTEKERRKFYSSLRPGMMQSRPFPPLSSKQSNESHLLKSPQQLNSHAGPSRRTRGEPAVPQINRLRESCALFKTIVNSQWFRNTSVILFLNKTDILEEKVQHSALSTHFPEFAGPEKDPSAAKDFILNKYTKSFDRLKHTKRTMYVHYTCATDTNNIKFVFAAVKDIIVQSYLINYNLV